MEKVNESQLLRFIGYGPKRRAAKIVFLGLEERAREGDKNLRARASFRRIEDLREAHENILGPAGCINPFNEKVGGSSRRKGKNPVRVWNMASRFALAFLGENWRSRDKWAAYWRDQLGQEHGETFLMESFPYPCNSHKEKLSKRSKLSAEKIKVWKRRVKVLQQYLGRFPPQFVIAYGKETKEKVSDLFKLHKTAWRKIPGCRNSAWVASRGQTRIAHVGFFGRGNFHKKDIPAIVKALRRK